MMPVPSPPAASVPSAVTVVIEAVCWSCGVPVRKTVRRGQARWVCLTWECVPCGVGWTGPGEMRRAG